MKNYLNKLLYRNKNFDISSTTDQLDIWENSCESENTEYQKETPNSIWTYWHDNEIPKSVQICVASWRKNNPDFKINIVNHSNLNTFLPDFRFDDYYNKNIANISDIIRLKLLYLYGGIWLDASVFLNTSLSTYIEQKESYNLDLLCFRGDGHNNDSNYPITESWFLITSPKNHFIKLWLDTLDECFRKVNFDNYFPSKYPEIYNSIEEKNRNYLFVYMASQVAMRHSSNIKIGFLNSRLNGFFYNYLFKFDYIKISKYFLLDSNYKKFPSIIKLMSKNRNALDSLIQAKMYKKNTMFGQYI